jgi:hypothetical protein
MSDEALAVKWSTDPQPKPIVPALNRRMLLENGTVYASDWSGSKKTDFSFGSSIIGVPKELESEAEILSRLADKMEAAAAELRALIGA